MAGEFDVQVMAYGREMIARAAGTKKGKWWWVWLKGKDMKQKYFLGYVQGDRTAAVEMARTYWPNFVGRMKIEVRPSHVNNIPLLNVICELCGCFFPRERQRQKCCTTCEPD